LVAKGLVDRACVVGAWVAGACVGAEVCVFLGSVWLVLDVWFASVDLVD